MIRMKQQLVFSYDDKDTVVLYPHQYHSGIESHPLRKVETELSSIDENGFYLSPLGTNYERIAS